MARAYRKKPVVVEAVQWTGENRAEMCEFIDPEVFEIKPKEGLIIHTLEGDHHASPGDYIIKGVNGEFYPCKPDIFAKTYEPATLTPPNEWVSVEEWKEIKSEKPEPGQRVLTMGMYGMITDAIYRKSKFSDEMEFLPFMGWKFLFWREMPELPKGVVLSAH